MRAEIIRIGNSRGLRIPKTVLEQCGMKRAVNLEITDHSLIITPCEETRSGWTESFELMAKNKDDELLDTDSITHSWDHEEWQW